MFRSAAGSSPLARGLPPALLVFAHAAGIIPARAGFTVRALNPHQLAWDHPRSRGVYGLVLGGLVNQPGSSPLARGLQAGGPSGDAAARIIPARAGFTLRCRHVGRLYRDHPRSRGVYDVEAWDVLDAAGSSPLARGLPDGLDAGGHRHGIIPARAGFTGRGKCRARRGRDHPRSRGVYTAAERRIRPRLGSSPLARGLHLRIPGIPTTSHTTRPRLPSLPT